MKNLNNSTNSNNISSRNSLKFKVIKIIKYVLQALVVTVFILILLAYVAHRCSNSDNSSSSIIRPSNNGSSVGLFANTPSGYCYTLSGGFDMDEPKREFVNDFDFFTRLSLKDPDDREVVSGTIDAYLVYNPTPTSTYPIVTYPYSYFLGTANDTDLYFYSKGISLSPDYLLHFTYSTYAKYSLYWVRSVTISYVNVSDSVVIDLFTVDGVYNYSTSEYIATELYLPSNLSLVLDPMYFANTYYEYLGFYPHADYSFSQTSGTISRASLSGNALFNYFYYAVINSFNLPMVIQNYSPTVQDVYDTGYANGNTNGYSTGYNKGLGEGYDTGYQIGYIDGSEDGNPDAYNAGYASGYNVASTEKLTNPLSFILDPVTEFFNIKLFGVVSIGMLLSIGVTILCACIFLRMFAGG